jgi:putative membrane protein
MVVSERTFRRILPPLPVAPRIFLSLGLIAIYCVLVGVAEQRFDMPPFTWGAEVTILNGLVLGVLLNFRNTAAYNRWWDGRSLWGQLVNHSRNLCLKVRAFLETDPAERRELAELITGFAEALRDRLRDERAHAPPPEPDADLPAETKGPAHEPIRLAGLLFDRLASWLREGRIDGWTLQVLNADVSALMDICGGCEKIKSTPLSFSYRALLRHGTFVYLLLSPMLSAREVGWLGLPAFLLVAYFLIGLEVVADDVEEPFGRAGDDLDLDRICATIRASVAEILGVDAGQVAPAGSKAS